ncbi:hypothetical protein KQX62_12030 [Rhodopseudomonas palustris]|uniref:Uncharacterized protein n=1 Tax=Rhodopseudomonas palustris TaxID=1076 RepID=A0AAX3DU66_RHOPL|nr:hypothetical protein [Rhodopseudomonas palustris]UYO37487.1 hypothetical protein KQX62_12030 [Rhodopseudomonas palustris]
MPPLQTPSNVDTGKLLSALAGSTLYAEISAEQAAKVAERRVEIAAELKKLIDGAMAQRDKREAAEVAAAGELKAAEAAVIEARKKLAAAQSVKLTASFAFSNRHDALQAELRHTASPAIAEFLRWIRDEEDRLRRIPSDATVVSGTRQIVPQGERDKITGAWREIKRTEPYHIERVWKAQDALAAARTAAEEMQLDPDQSEVAERIEALRTSIPEVK